MKKLKIKRLDPNFPLPAYQTSGSIAFDLYSRIIITIKPRQIERIPSNLIVEVPKDYALIVASRSSGPSKFGLMLPHGIGVIDQDYCGPDDELQVQVYNFTDQNVQILPGERIAQALLVRVDQFEIMETKKLSLRNRGGFGSTGHN